MNTAFLAAVEPVVIEKAEGVNYFDEDGTKYLDCFAGISVVDSGHGNEMVNTAAKEQIDKLIHWFPSKRRECIDHDTCKNLGPGKFPDEMGYKSASIIPFVSKNLGCNYSGNKSYDAKAPP